ncbi:hypothetical protein LTR78_001029 [Recurvomyces mirabilis]|uniref:F-box domain-containing protein n=1 Tax=Recurvomyces mirabilis TaxID=574656 RepID=A0AAE0WX26_9PEZI|nr:hypothetical protein LTR78_001029 [Recurvomyces mirabilis]KAK5159001.1 hypothetical protein LTS14_003109 [Recurvomyces mirabilis]
MAAEQQPRRALKRSKSLKNLLSRNAKPPAPTAEDEELLPCRPVKQKYVQFHVTTDDIHLRPTTAGATPIVPQRTSSQRQTWPQSTAERSRPGRYAFENTPTLTQTPWELERHTRRPRSQRIPLVDLRPLPKNIFEHLPREIYHCILDHVESLHKQKSQVDVVSLHSDLKALSLVNKRWHRAAREHLYREVWLPNNDDLPRRTLSLHRSTTRLKQLLRTLDESDALAFMVRHLRVTANLACMLEGVDHTQATRRATIDLVAAIINRCANLEDFSGYNPSIRDAASTKLFFPLALRPNIRSHAWNAQVAQFGGRQLPTFDAGEVLDCHDDWQWLETLVICSSSDLSLGLGLVAAIVQRLPSLKHLMLSRLNRQDFHNGTLLSLPGLRSLRLDHLDGLTDQGVEQLAHMRLASTVESLSLIGLELTSLRTIQQLWTNLGRLRKFTLVQNTSPEMLPGMQAANVNRALGSATLQDLHWDVLVAGTGTSLIANAIASGRLPSLRRIKVPCDYEGVVQELCRPIVQETLDALDLEMIDRFDSDRYERFLRLSQIQAQLRIRESRQQPAFNVVVHDEHKRVSATHVIGSYVGDMESQVEYTLEPDVEGSHDALIDFADVEAPKWVYERRNEMDRSIFGEQALDLKMLF